MVGTSDLGHLFWLYRLLQRIRPFEVAIFLKKLLRIRRREVQLSNGMVFWLDPVSHLGFELLVRGEYEPEMVQLLKGVLRSGDVFIDVGSNEGFFSLTAANLVGPAGLVLAVEPQSRLQEVQAKNFSLNRAGNIRLCGLALGEGPGNLVLTLGSELNSGSSSFFASKNWRLKSEAVSVTTLDLLLEAKKVTGRIRLMKIDCEGAEQLVLLGAKETLAHRKIDFITVDFHEAITGNRVVQEIDTQLRRCGYVLSRISNGTWVYHLPEGERELENLGPVQRVDAI